MEKSFGLQFLYHFWTELAPVLLRHPSVLRQRCHVSAFGLKKGQAARLNPSFCVETPYDIPTFLKTAQGALLEIRGGGGVLRNAVV